MRIVIISTLLLVGIISTLFSQKVSPQLLLSASDVRVEESLNDDGLLIYVRAKSGIGSVMLTESAENPINLDVNTYALQTSEYNIYNSDERRLLNGQYIQLRDGYFIIDSSVVFDDTFLQEAFILFLPYQVTYGYKSTRNGILDFTRGTNVINIRTFEYAYADYSGEYADNSFYIRKIDAIAEPPEIPFIEKLVKPKDVPSAPPSVIGTVPIGEEAEEDIDTSIARDNNIVTTNRELSKLLLFQDTSRYSDETVEAFTEIAERMNTTPLFIERSSDIPKSIVAIMQDVDPEKSIDVIVLLDTTKSMWDDITAVKSSLVPLLQSKLSDRNFRMGLVYYRDKDDNEYEISEINFIDKSQLPLLQKKLGVARAIHGGDWPESVHEAMKVAAENFTWLSQERIVFLVGDAPPHLPPRDGLNVDAIYEKLKLKKVKLYPFIVPVR